MKCCHACGQTLPEEGPSGLKLRGTKKVLFERVKKAGKNGIDSDVLFNYVWGNVPSSPTKCTMHQHLSRLNSILVDFRLKIKGSGMGRGGMSYTLVKL